MNPTSSSPHCCLPPFLDSLRENSLYSSRLNLTLLFLSIFLFLGEKTWLEFLCVWLIKPLEKEIMRQRPTEIQRLSSIDITQQLCHLKRNLVINMPGMGVLVWVVMQAGRIYRVPAALQTTVPVTVGNYVGARHSNKNKRDRTKKHWKIHREKKFTLRSTCIIWYIITWVLRMWLQWQKQLEPGGDCLVRPHGGEERWLWIPRWICISVEETKQRCSGGLQQWGSKATGRP